MVNMELLFFCRCAAVNAPKTISPQDGKTQRLFDTTFFTVPRKQWRYVGLNIRRRQIRFLHPWKADLVQPTFNLEALK